MFIYDVGLRRVFDLKLAIRLIIALFFAYLSMLFF